MGSVRKRVAVLKVWLCRTPEKQSVFNNRYQTYKAELKQTKANNIKNFYY